MTQNFPKELTEANFKNKLADHGIELKVITDSELWNDYTETDCVLAIRDFSDKPHFNKPFSKIINISNNIDKIQETKTFLLSNRKNFICFNSKKFAKQFVDLITALN